MNLGALGSKKFNQLLAQLGAGPSVGEVRHSMLSEAEFQQYNGSSWVLMDGRDVSGSAYHQIKGQATIPDARGQFLRGKNNGRADGNENPDGDVALGLFQDHEQMQHNHGPGNLSGYYRMRNDDNNGNSVWGGEAYLYSGFDTNSSGGAVVIDSGATSNAGGNENRPRNITVNIFIKINW